MIAGSPVITICDTRSLLAVVVGVSYLLHTCSLLHKVDTLFQTLSHLLQPSPKITVK